MAIENFWLGAVCPVASGVAVAMAEMYVYERKIPFVGNGPGRSVPWYFLLSAYVINLIYAGPMAHWFFAASDPRQYFLAALAAIETFGGRKPTHSPPRPAAAAPAPGDD